MNDVWLRCVETLARDVKDQRMTRKVDTYEYESLEKMILNGELPLKEIKEIFTDRFYNAWFTDRNFI